MALTRLRRRLNDDPNLKLRTRQAIRARRKGLRTMDTVLRTAAEFDQWLRAHFGRPYTALLSLGLVFGIIEGFRKLIGEIAAAQHFNAWTVGFIVVFQGALLTNQLAQFHAQREARRAERAQVGGPEAAQIEGAETAAIASNLQDVP